MPHARSFILPLLVFATAAAAQPPAASDPAALRARLDVAIATAAWDSAAGPAEELAGLAQADYHAALYTLLRVHCLRGNRHDAYQVLDLLLDGGWGEYQQLRTDPDLALIGQEERCRTMVRKAWSRQYIRMLDRDSRDAVQKPAEVMATLAFRSGERVADVGAGSGYFTLRVAEAVGDAGHVLALDIRQEMLDHIANRLREAQLTNVELKQVPADDPQLPPGGLDTILMVDTIHYVQDRASYARKLREGLAPGGRLVVIDFRYDPAAQREFAPPIEQQVPREALDAEMAAAGLKVVASYDYLPEQYFVVYAAQ
jgi:ubiquinone/menaquinone biosynthesis C-methylase UbiE